MNDVQLNSIMPVYLYGHYISRVWCTIGKVGDDHHHHHQQYAVSADNRTEGRPRDITAAVVVVVVVVVGWRALGGIRQAVVSCPST